MVQEPFFTLPVAAVPTVQDTVVTTMGVVTTVSKNLLSHMRKSNNSLI